LIGKEGNFLDLRTRGLLTTIEANTEYADPAQDPWTTHILPTLQDFAPIDLARVSGLPLRTLYDVRVGRRPKTPAQKHQLTLTAAHLAHERLAQWKREVNLPRNGPNPQPSLPPRTTQYAKADPPRLPSRTRRTPATLLLPPLSDAAPALDREARMTPRTLRLGAA
jgi:hypothetical protein